MNQQAADASTRGRGFSGEQPVRGWDSLQHGDCVSVWTFDSFRYIGSVDERADDGQLIWVIENGTGCRHLFARTDPVMLYPN